VWTAWLTRGVVFSSYHHLPIVEQDSFVPVGIVSLTDLVAAMCPFLNEGKAPSLTPLDSMISLLTRAGSRSSDTGAAAAEISAAHADAQKQKQAA